MNNPEDGIQEITFGAKVDHMVSPDFSRSAVMRGGEWVLLRSTHGEVCAEAQEIDGVPYSYHFMELAWMQVGKTDLFAIAQMWINGGPP